MRSVGTRNRLVRLALSTLLLGGCASTPTVMTGRDLLALPQPPADRTVAYGPGDLQLAELRVPRGPGPHPVAVVIHGGCWEAPWGLDHIRSLCAALADEGLATWSLEYRRLGDPGGGWPGTFEDVARGADHLQQVAGEHHLDLQRVVAVGHSAGGHLALWLAGRHRLPPDGPGWSETPLRLRGVVSLAGVPDLGEGARRDVCGDAIPRLLGAPPAAKTERLRLASPAELLPLGVPQHLVSAELDTIVPPDLATAYAAVARDRGDTVTLETLDGAGHFELVNPDSAAWPAVRDAVRRLAGVQ